MMPCDPGGTRPQPNCDKQHVKSVSFRRLAAARCRSRHHKFSSRIQRDCLRHNRAGNTSKSRNAIQACECDAVSFPGPCVTLRMEMTRYTVSEGDTHTHTVSVAPWYFGRCESPSQTLLGQYCDTPLLQEEAGCRCRHMTSRQQMNPSPCPTFADCTCLHHPHPTPRFIGDWAAELQERALCETLETSPPPTVLALLKQNLSHSVFLLSSTNRPDRFLKYPKLSPAVTQTVCTWRDTAYPR